jgi:hypothetical protein
MLKFLPEFSKAVFFGVTMKSLLNADSIWSGLTTN